MTLRVLHQSVVCSQAPAHFSKHPYRPQAGLIGTTVWLDNIFQPALPSCFSTEIYFVFQAFSTRPNNVQPIVFCPSAFPNSKTDPNPNATAPLANKWVKLEETNYGDEVDVGIFLFRPKGVGRVDFGWGLCGGGWDEWCIHNQILDGKVYIKLGTYVHCGSEFPSKT